MLDAGCIRHLHDRHGVTVLVTTGTSAGKSFNGTVEIAEDIVFNGATGAEDRRSKRILRFQYSAGVPSLESQDIVSIDGKKWNAVRNMGSDYLEANYELKEIAKEDA